MEKIQNMTKTVFLLSYKVLQISLIFLAPILVLHTSSNQSQKCCFSTQNFLSKLKKRSFLFIHIFVDCD